jgi:hypothetical protein
MPRTKQTARRMQCMYCFGFFHSANHCPKKIKHRNLKAIADAVKLDALKKKRDARKKKEKYKSVTSLPNIIEIPKNTSSRKISSRPAFLLNRQYSQNPLDIPESSASSSSGSDSTKNSCLSDSSRILTNRISETGIEHVPVRMPARKKSRPCAQCRRMSAFLCSLCTANLCITRMDDGPKHDTCWFKYHNDRA